VIVDYHQGKTQLQHTARFSLILSTISQADLQRIPAWGNVILFPDPVKKAAWHCTAWLKYKSEE